VSRVSLWDPKGCHGIHRTTVGSRDPLYISGSQRGPKGPKEIQTYPKGSRGPLRDHEGCYGMVITGFQRAPANFNKILDSRVFLSINLETHSNNAKNC